MKNIYSFLIAGCIIASCNNSTSTEKQTSESVTPPEEAAMNCYTGVSGKDSVMLNITSNGDKITGTLNYKFSEKDSNHGSIDGIMKGDTLLADYSFASEGQSSIRQVAFLKKDNSMIEGYGDLEEKDGKVQFKNPATLDFGKGFNLQKVDCR
ncbi:MAG: hypothetical protein ABIR18_10500 [Chitinophagaceae bacterium]